MASCPSAGHVGPVCAVAADLVRRGHRVRVLTGSTYATQVESSGAEFLALPSEAVVDLDAEDRSPAGRPVGVRGIGYDVEHMFLRPMAGQYAALQAALAAEPASVLITEMLYMGAYPLTARPRADRPLVVLLGITPLPVAGGGTGPYGMGLRPDGGLRPLRNRVLRALTSRFVFADAEAYLAAEFERLTGVPSAGSVFDLPLRTDVVLQLSPPGLEYPRPGLPVSVRFVGPLPTPVRGLPDPPWAADLDGELPVVHVTQGTVANRDVGKLIVPAVAALAERPVLVVLTAGGRSEEALREAVVGALGRVPPNVRTARFLDYTRLLPKVDALVTNGGFGTVTQALAHGVPLVVAGRSEDKAEVGARVAWSGAGIDLRTDTPSADRLDRAVGRVLFEPRYRAAARRLREQVAGQSALDAADALVRSA